MGWRKEYFVRHAKSRDHKNAITEPQTALQAQKVFDKVLSCAAEETIVLMRNVYFLAHESIAIMKAKELHKHVQLLGCKISQSHQGEYSSWEFIHSMSELIEEEVIKELRMSQYFSLIADESNDIAVNKNLLLYVKYLNKNDVRLVFLKLLKLEKADATTVYDSIMTYIREKQIEPSRIVMFTSDGAQVMLGKYNGVQAKLKGSYLTFLNTQITLNII